MFVLVNNEGNTDGDFSIMVVGTYDRIEDAQRAMTADLNAYVEECGWQWGEHKVLDRQAYALDGDVWEHEHYSVWVIFDDEYQRRWISWNWRAW